MLCLSSPAGQNTTVRPPASCRQRSDQCPRGAAPPTIRPSFGCVPARIDAVAASHPIPRVAPANPPLVSSIDDLPRLQHQTHRPVPPSVYAATSPAVSSLPSYPRCSSPSPPWSRNSYSSPASSPPLGFAAASAFVPPLSFVFPQSPHSSEPLPPHQAAATSRTAFSLDTEWMGKRHSRGPLHDTSITPAARLSSLSSPSASSSASEPARPLCRLLFPSSGTPPPRCPRPLLVDCVSHIHGALPRSSASSSSRPALHRHASSLFSPSPRPRFPHLSRGLRRTPAPLPPPRHRILDLCAGAAAARSDAFGRVWAMGRVMWEMHGRVERDKWARGRSK
ncbi:hypothetical protein C8R45DRAFT_1216675 [Mycena sanguinolenta]|nr:hypothetical protein C8R45DRAFT_1216675 [Mycena sanguinolenta]